MKKALSLVLTMCMVLSLFATFVISASAEATNVALNKEYTISGCGTTFAQYTASLTDGAAQPNLTYDGNWFTFYCNGDNQSVINAPDHVGYVIIDLEGLYDITSVKANCYDNKGDSGILGPKAINVYLSTDGENWSDAKSATVPTLEAGSNFTAEVAVSGKAQFVKFEMVINGVFGFVNEVEVYGTEASAVVEDKVINLLAQPGTVECANFADDEIVYTLDENGFNISHTGSSWPNATLKFNAPVTIDVAKTYLEIEATVTGGNGTSIRLLGPVDDAGAVETDDIYLQHFDTDVTPDGGGDAPAGSTISYKLPVSELAYCIYDKANNYAGKNPITADEISFIGLQVFASGKDCVVNITKLNLIVPGEASNVVKETITVDGDLSDNGWAKKGWINVSGENGFWQYPTPKEIAAGAVIPTFTYKHQFRADDTKLYGAVVLDGVHEEDKNIKVRVWFRNNDEATVYSSFYDFVLAPDGTLETAAKYNTSTTTNAGAAIENTTLVAAAKVVDGKTVFEFSIDLAEVADDGSFDYFVSLERKQGVNTGTLYYPAVPAGPEDAPHANLPWLLWYAETDATVNVEDIVLGEIVVSDKEEADTSMMGTAPADPAFTVTLATEDGWKAGEKLVVTATVDVLKDGVDLSQILFNLYYDAADVEIVLPEELGAIITAGAESWKEDSLFTLSVDGDYGVIECAPATTVEADVLKKGTQLVMTFEFTVKADAEGLINFQLSNKGLTGYSWDIDAAEVAGAGSSLAVGNADELGDTGIYVIAALALVALIGTAIVIKKRA